MPGKTCAQCLGWGIVLAIATPPPTRSEDRRLLLQRKLGKELAREMNVKSTVCTACGGYGTR